MTKEELAKKLADAEGRLASIAAAATMVIDAYDQGGDLEGAFRRFRRSALGTGYQQWGRGAVREAGLRWAEQYGEPPKALDWNPTVAVKKGHHEAAERFYEGDWPHYELARYHFGSWSGFMQDLGFEPRKGPDTFATGPIDDERLPPWNGWEFLRSYRSRMGLTQTQLAKLAGVSHGLVWHVETGRSTNPGVRILLALAKPLGVPPAAFFE